MHRQYRRWFSPALQRDMELLIFGHGGAKVIVFPTSMGRFYEWEDRGMVSALGEHLNNGWIQLYCIDTVDKESWYDRHKPGWAQARRQEEYERYIRDEVVPLGNYLNWTPFWMTTGASFGTYHAANFAFKHPWLINRMIGLSGIYDIGRFANGDGGEGVYFNNPPAYLRNEHDGSRLDALRRQDIIIVTGTDDPNRWSSEALSTILWDRGIGNALRLWNGWAHDWPYWTQMIRAYIDGHD